MEYSNISLRHKNRLASPRATDSINSFFPKNCSDHLAESDSETRVFEIYDEDTEMIEETEIEETFYSDERCFLCKLYKKFLKLLFIVKTYFIPDLLLS